MDALNTHHERDQARTADALCRRAGTDDLIDATVALVSPAAMDTRVLTFDPDDIEHLLGVLEADLVKVVRIST